MKSFHLKQFLAALGILPILCLTSCKKLVEVAPPDNQLITSTVFNDSIGATSAVIGIYTNLNPYTGFVFGNGAITAYTGLSSDELLINNGSSDEDQFYTNSIATNNAVNNANLWSNAYGLIYQINACIEALSSSANLTSSLRSQLLGECKFLRAFIYFYLVNLYADIPLVTTTNYQESATQSRTPADSIYKQITTDLEDAVSSLIAPDINGTGARVDKYAATCLLARVYLFKEEWKEAEAAAGEIIGSGKYALESDLNNVFLTNNTESVWQIPPYSMQGFETTEGYFFVPSDVTVTPKYVISPYLLGAFESGDERKEKWLNKNSIDVDGTVIDYYYPYKYKLGYDGNTNPLENYIMLRLAEQYLIRAEARAHLNDLTNSLADLNVIRNRSGLPNAAFSTQTALINAILHEKQVEFFCEWGHRWFDLKRTKIIDSILSPKKPSWQATASLFPIPVQQIHTNPFLIQNPGY